MTWRHYSPILFIVIILTVTALSCNLPGEPTPTVDVAEIQRQTEEAAEAAEPPPEPPAPTPTTEIVHVTFPTGPTTLPSYLTDRSSIEFADEGRTIGDSFIANLFERPFTETEMEYRAYLDITHANIGVEEPWIYFTIHLEGLPPAGTIVTYGAEMDVDIDGRGDYLLSALLPEGTEWTTDGVKVVTDLDEDVGGENPMRSDPPNEAWTGYEEVLFDSGIGEDADSAWIRIHPDKENVIELAIKHAVIGSDRDFMWGVWSDEGVREHTWLDYNDHFTAEEAGSPAIVDEVYPLAALNLVDNTCRWVYGFNPSGEELGICRVPPPPPGEPSEETGFLVCRRTGGVAAIVQVCTCEPTCPTAPRIPCPPCVMD